MIGIDVLYLALSIFYAKTIITKKHALYLLLIWMLMIISMIFKSMGELSIKVEFSYLFMNP
jgi:hypothetical protein